MKIDMYGVEVNELPYERQVMKHIVKILKNPRTIVDVGANIGWYSVILAKLYPNSKVYAFEPVEETYFNLFRNVINNGLLKRVQPQLTVLLDEMREVIFNYNIDYPASSSVKKLLGGEIISVKKISKKLDYYCFQDVDFIKIDTEGSELFVLRGAIKTLKKSHPIVQCEMLRKWSKKFNYHPNDIIKFMKKLGYKCFSLGYEMKEIKKVTNKTIETNFVFL